MNIAALHRFLDEQFPQATGTGVRIESLEDAVLLARQPIGEAHLRPGSTVSGPTMMTLVDTAAYLLLLSRLGPVALAVTTHLSIDFLRRPAPVDILVRCELLKLGQRLAVCRATLFSEGSDDALALASITYSIPPPHRREPEQTPADTAS